MRQRRFLLQEKRGNNVKIIFMSGVELGYNCLKAIIEKGYKVEHVFSYSDDMSDRSGYVDFSEICKRNKIELTKTSDINSKENVQKIKNIEPDVIFVIGWSSIINREILRIPKIGVIGHHPTLLPKHRGNAPIPWTLINGLTRSGITFMFLEEEVDRGDILIQKEFEVKMDYDASDLYKIVTEKTIEALFELLPKLEEGTYERVKQDPKRASLWRKRKPQDGIIDWNSMNIYLYNWIRGLTHPYPGAFTYYKDKKLLIWKAKISGENAEGNPGQISFKDEKIFIKTGDGVLELLRLNFEDENEMSSKEFLEKHPYLDGKMLG